MWRMLARNGLPIPPLPIHRTHLSSSQQASISVSNRSCGDPNSHHLFSRRERFTYTSDRSLVQKSNVCFLHIPHGFSRSFCKSAPPRPALSHVILGGWFRSAVPDQPDIPFSVPGPIMSWEFPSENSLKEIGDIAHRGQRIKLSKNVSRTVSHQTKNF